jgi:pyruvate/2-oxoglutarate/acetoin dehydrogenase E1 component
VVPWITYADAITEALRVEMRLDPTVLCLTCAPAEGPRPTDQLQREFGASRVTEHAECASILAAAAAAASEGMRPVCELRLGDLEDGDAGRLAEAAGAGGLVLRLVSGGGPAEGRASGWEGLLAAVPELKIVSPATASDAKGLLISAIRSPDPVGFIECRDLYTAVCDGVPEGDHVVPLGEARLLTRGDEIVVLAHGPAAIAAQRATVEMSGDVRLMDLRTLRPLDDDAVLDSVRELGKVLIVEQPGARVGLVDGLTRMIDAEAADHLDAPVRELEDGSGESNDLTASVEEACRELVAF